MEDQQIIDNIADSQPERMAESQYEERTRDKQGDTRKLEHTGLAEERSDYMKDKYTPSLDELRPKGVKNDIALVECLRESENYDEFCQKCNKLLNKQDALPIDLWNEYWERYK